MLETTSPVPVPDGKPQLAFEPFLPWYLLLPLALAILFLAIRSYARSTRPLLPSRRFLLWLLRATAAAVVMLCLARPILVQAVGLREKGLCFLALDDSASMNIRDLPERQSRYEFAGRFFARHQDELAGLTERFELRRYTFGARAQEAASLPGEGRHTQTTPPGGRATDLAALAEALLEEGQGASCAGALLLSDGRHNTGRDPVPLAAALNQANLPLYIVGLGQEQTPQGYQELQIKTLEVPERGFVGSQLLVKTTLEYTLPEPAEVPFKLTVNGETIYETSLSLPAGANALKRLEIPITPTALGIHRVAAEAGVLPGEPNPHNNRKTAYLKVYRNRLGVWYIEGAVRKEFGALRSALETAPNVRLQAANAFARREPPESDLLPAAESEWADLKLVIIGDLPRPRFDREQLKRLLKFVEEGGAFLMIGGLNNFGLGGWHQSVLSPAFPVLMSYGDKAIEGRLPIGLTEEGRRHSVLRLAESEAASAEVWDKLPPMPGLSALSGTKPAAKVLLTAGAHPLLVVQDYGKGRGAAFTGDMTWQWILKAGQADAHRRFWRNLVTWLTRSEYRDSEQLVFIESDRLQYLVGDEVSLAIQVQETEGTKERVRAAKIVASLSQENGVRKSWSLGQGPGERLERIKPREPGSYSFSVEAFDPSGATLGKDSVSFEVQEWDLETENPRADLRLLRRLAAASGGLYFDPEQGDQALKALLQRQAGFSKTTREVSELWNHWSLFSLFVLLLTLEWSLRKRWGLA